MDENIDRVSSGEVGKGQDQAVGPIRDVRRSWVAQRFLRWEGMS